MSSISEEEENMEQKIAKIALSDLKKVIWCGKIFKIFKN